MAKKSKTDRKAVIDDIRKKQGRTDRLRGFAIVGVCVLIAVGIVGAAAFGPIKNAVELSAYDDQKLQEIGPSAKEASCTKLEEIQADGNQQHQPTGSQIVYSTAPPAFGPHWNEANVAPASMERKFYTADDRPELESLVHNLEHGYTILWYDETVEGEDLNAIRAIAEKFSGTDNWRYKFIAAPWTAADQEETFVEGKKRTQFPEGKHIALTHWSIGGTGGPGIQDPSKQTGVFQYCAAPSGEVVKKIMKDFPYTDSPEPNGM